MKISIVTLYTPEISDYGTITSMNKAQYARRHGYQFTAITSTLDSTRHSAWSKVLLLSRELQGSDWVFWTDADSLVMESSYRLEEIIDKAGDVDMIVGSDVVSPYNTGQWLVKSSAWSASFLNQIWTHPEHPTRRSPPWDQGAFLNLLERHPEARKRVAVMPLRELNATMRFYHTPTGHNTNWEMTYKNNYEISEYLPGDFIVHFMFCKNHEMRLRGIKECAAIASCAET